MHDQHRPAKDSETQMKWDMREPASSVSSGADDDDEEEDEQAEDEDGAGDEDTEEDDEETEDDDEDEEEEAVGEAAGDLTCFLQRARHSQSKQMNAQNRLSIHGTSSWASAS